ncbi:hypothetical protein Mapa_013394 [Marchantia paleacea]|nr:hypothetical protein Mapa_013394 [Marchantia paleacea]
MCQLIFKETCRKHERKRVCSLEMEVEEAGRFWQGWRVELIRAETEKESRASTLFLVGEFVYLVATNDIVTIASER